MKPWIVLTGISLILDIFNILKAVISLAFADALSSIFGWVLGAYLFLVVWSFKAEVEVGEEAVGITRVRFTSRGKRGKC